MIEDKSTVEPVKKRNLISECIEDIIEVFEDTDYTRIDILSSIRSACKEKILKVRGEYNLRFSYQDIYVISRIPQTSNLNRPDCVWATDEFCVETGCLLTGIQSVEDIKKVVYRNFYNTDKVNIYRVREEYTSSLRDFISEFEYRAPSCIIIEPWDQDRVAEILEHSFVDYIPVVCLGL
jgi:hypothetical protein